MLAQDHDMLIVQNPAAAGVDQPAGRITVVFGESGSRPAVRTQG